MTGSLAAKPGRKVLLYRNTGTYGTPVWVQVSNRRDFTLNGTTVEADASDADSGVEETVVVARGYELSGNIRWADSAADWEILRAAYDADPRTPIEFAVMYGPIATTGSTGRRITCDVTQFSESYAFKDILAADVTLKPTPNADHKPEIYTVS